MDSPAQPGVIYTCPMHPHIRQLGPGSCPICGMTLEPLLPAATQDDDRELRAVRRKFWISSGLSAPVVLIAMVSHVLPVNPGLGGMWLVRCMEVLLTAPVVLWAAADYYRGGWLGVVKRSPNMYTLIGLGDGNRHCDGKRAGDARDLDGIVRARQLSRATVRNIHQNLAFAFGYNTLGIPIAAGMSTICGEPVESRLAGTSSSNAWRRSGAGSLSIQGDT